MTAVRLAGMILVLAGVLARPAFGQSDSTATVPVEPARRLVRLMHADSTGAAGAEVAITLLRQNPDLAPYEDVFRSWYRSLFASREFEDEITTLYARHFNDAEIEGLIAFYASPLGQKMVVTMPELTRDVAESSTRLVQKHSGQLMAMIEQERARRASMKSGK